MGRNRSQPSLPPSCLPSGAMILTATAIQDFYAILGAFGIGFDCANAAGVMVTTHVAANQVGREGGRAGGGEDVPTSPT